MNIYKLIVKATNIFALCLCLLISGFSITFAAASENKQVTNSNTFDEVLNKGDVWFGIHNIKYALREYNNASKINPTSPVVPYKIGECYRYQGKFDKAIKSYSKSIELDSGYAPANAGIGACYNSMKKYDKARPYLEKAVNAEPQNLIANLEIGKNYLQDEKNGNVATAITFLTVAMQVAPNSLEAWYNLGIAYDENRHYDDAIMALEKVVTMYGDYANGIAAYKLGNIYEKKGDYEKAVAIYKKSSNRYSLYEVARVYLAYLNDPREALSYLDRTDVDNTWSKDILTDVITPYDKSLYVNTGLLRCIAYVNMGLISDAMKSREAIEKSNLMIYSELLNEYDSLMQRPMGAIGKSANKKEELRSQWSKDWGNFCKKMLQIKN